MFSRTIRIGIRLALSLALGLAIAFGALNPRSRRRRCTPRPPTRLRSVHLVIDCPFLSKTMTDRQRPPVDLRGADSRAGRLERLSRVFAEDFIRRTGSPGRRPSARPSRSSMLTTTRRSSTTSTCSMSLEPPAFPGCSATVTTSCFQRVDQNGAAKGFANSSASSRENGITKRTSMSRQPMPSASTARSSSSRRSVPRRRPGQGSQHGRPPWRDGDFQQLRAGREQGRHDLLRVVLQPRWDPRSPRARATTGSARAIRPTSTP